MSKTTNSILLGKLAVRKDGAPERPWVTHWHGLPSGALRSRDYAEAWTFGESALACALAIARAWAWAWPVPGADEAGEVTTCPPNRSR